MKKLAAVASMVLVTSGVLAGTISVEPVEISLNPDGSGIARGSMATARFSNKPLESIACTAGAVASDGSAPFAWALCVARTGRGGMRTCYTEHPGLVEAVYSISDYSYIVFNWNADGVCEGISIETKSGFIP